MIRGNRVRIGLLLWLLLVMSFLTLSTTPSTLSLDSSISPQNNPAQRASISGSTTIFNTSTLGTIEDICIGPAGYLYATGSTSSPLFPIVNAFDETLNGTTDCFVMKLNGTDGSILYASFLGGNSSDYAKSISVDNAGNIYVLGLSNSADFPLVNPYNDFFNQTSQYFLTKFAADGQSLVYSTFFGAEFREGLNSVSLNSLVVDEQGNAYLGGGTVISTVPIVNAFDETYNGESDCYILKMNPTGTEIVYASFYGTEYPEMVDDLVYAGAGIIYLTGTTSICPTDDYYYSPGPDYGGHCFALKISENGTLLDSGEVKSSDFFPVTSIVVDSEYSVYILDEPSAANSFTIHKFDNELDLVYTKTMWWSQFTEVQDFSIDSENIIYIAGRTFAEDFVQNTSSSYSGEGDCFILCVDSSGSIVFSALYGTPLRESTKAIAVGENGQVYLAGTSIELYPIPPVYSCSFIISIKIPLTTANILGYPELLLAGSIGIAVLVIVIIVYQKRST